jgi:hypothetical protein
MVLKDKYSSVRQNNSNLLDVSEQELDAIEKIAKKENKKIRADKHLIASAAATILNFAIPFIIFKSFSYLSVVADYLSLKKGHYDKDFVTVITASLLWTGFGIICYIFVFPLFRNSKTEAVSKAGKLYNFDRKQRNFRVASVISIYLLFGIVLYMLHVHTDRFPTEIILALRIYMTVPVFALAFIAFVFILLYLSAPLFRKVSRREHLIDTRVQLCYLLLKALYQLQNENRAFLMPKQKMDDIAKSLVLASSLIRNYPNNLSNKILNSSVVTSFRLSANFIDQITIDIQTGNDSDRTKVIGRLVECLNIALQGNLLSLPKIEIEAGDLNAAKKVRLYHYILLACYLTLPIICVIAINIVFNVTFNEYNQSLLRILYVAWAFVGIFSNPVILNSENKELIRDIVKSWLGKG